MDHQKWIDGESSCGGRASRLKQVGLIQQPFVYSIWYYKAIQKITAIIFLVHRFFRIVMLM
jgi:hypothetical protein